MVSSFGFGFGFTQTHRANKSLLKKYSAGISLFFTANSGFWEFSVKWRDTCFSEVSDVLAIYVRFFFKDMTFGTLCYKISADGCRTQNKQPNSWV